MQRLPLKSAGQLLRKSAEKSNDNLERQTADKKFTITEPSERIESFKRKSTVIENGAGGVRKSTFLNNNQSAKKAVQLLQMYVTDNKRFASDILEKKITRINALESELQQIIEDLKDFFLEIKEIIYLDEVFVL